MYCSAAIGPLGRPLPRQLYESPEAARTALATELKRLRVRFPKEADDINDILDEMEASGDSFYVVFSLDGEEWTVWYHEV